MSSKSSGLLRILLGLTSCALVQTAPAREEIEEEFGGQAALSVYESTPSWPKLAHAGQGAPNIVLIILDDLGFADTGTFGGLVPTPALDALAANGLRYNRFHTTAICSSTRAALLSGRNHHRVGFGTISESGFPGYNGLWARSTASVAEMLRRNGYSTAAFGKWHNTPSWEITPVGPFDRWPTGLGFDYFFGFVAGGRIGKWNPGLVRNTFPVSPTRQEGYNLTEQIVDDAIRWIRVRDSLDTNRPYFIYVAPYATHYPHSVPKEWIGRFEGRFDKGWNDLREEIFRRQKQLGVVPRNAALSPWPHEIPTWDSLSADAKKLYSRQMEVYAAYVAQTDYEIGRLLEVVQSSNGGDNTLVIYILGDNGPEGTYGIHGSDDLHSTVHSPRSVDDQLKTIDKLGSLALSNVYSTGWAWLGATPFSWGKLVASHLGGIRDPMILSWPAKIKDRGTVRTQFAHVNDIAPTLLEVAGIEFPKTIDGVEQVPFDGVSLVYTFDDPDAASRHRTQYFEQLGNRGIYHDGWFASARLGIPWLRLENGELYTREHGRLVASSRRATQGELERVPWELYRIDDDFSQSKDLADEFPEKLRELKLLFDKEARENDVYPLDVGIFGVGPEPPYAEPQYTGD